MCKKILFLFLMMVVAVEATRSASVQAQDGLSQKTTLGPEPPATGLRDEYYDYSVYFAFPARIGFRVEEYSLDGKLMNSWDHESQKSAEQQKDFLENRMMLNYRLTAFEYPQTWFFYGRFDISVDAEAEAAYVRSLGFDTRIDRVPELQPKR